MAPLRLWTKDAAPAVGLRPQTLRKLRVTGGGPRFRYEGRRVYYRDRDLREWLEARRSFSSTAERKAAVRCYGRPKKGSRVNAESCGSRAECTSATADPGDVRRAG